MGKGQVGLAFYKLALLLAHGDVRSLQPHSCWHELHHTFPTRSTVPSHKTNPRSLALVWSGNVWQQREEQLIQTV